jgi:ABC-2 type transport system ATP-binding protein
MSLDRSAAVLEAPAVIEARGLIKKYGERTVVAGLDLRVAPGELYALLGGNGAGKTTTLHALLGLITLDGGTVIIDGHHVDPGHRPRAAFVPEVVDLYPELDAIETLELFAAVGGKAHDRAALLAALERAGLEASAAERRLRTYSKGMRQKVALAAAELLGAKALILDEPTSGLDPTAAEQLMNRLIAIKRQGAAILMSTHDVYQVTAFADRIGILKGGRLVAEEDASKLDGPALVELYRRCG